MTDTKQATASIAATLSEASKQLEAARRALEPTLDPNDLLDEILPEEKTPYDSEPNEDNEADDVLDTLGAPRTVRNYLTELLKTHTERTIGYQRGEAGDVYRISRGTRTTFYDAHDRPLEFIDFLDPYLRAPANKLPELTGWYTESGRYVLEAGEVDGEPYIISVYETPFDWDR